MTELLAAGFTDSFRAINENFGRVFTELFGGGEASLVLEDESDVLACGIGIQLVELPFPRPGKERGLAHRLFHRLEPHCGQDKSRRDTQRSVWL